ncbi:hypothetical protein EDD15DRAFT_954912 [Pisolithus albus]|nr:hypothetical protein EDD15DRAFT_954912 [Pisolithus albus]
MHKFLNWEQLYTVLFNALELPSLSIVRGLSSHHTDSLLLLTCNEYMPRDQFPSFIPTPSATSAAPVRQIHRDVPTNDCLPPGEEQGEISSDDSLQSDSLLELRRPSRNPNACYQGPWFSGYHAQIADNGCCSVSVHPHDSVPFPIAGSVHGAEGNFPLRYPNPLGGYPKDRYSGDGDITVISPLILVGPTPASNALQPPPRFSLNTSQYPSLRMYLLMTDGLVAGEEMGTLVTFS